MRRTLHVHWLMIVESLYDVRCSCTNCNTPVYSLINQTWVKPNPSYAQRCEVETEHK
jgi:hypothetical protein